MDKTKCQKAIAFYRAKFKELDIPAQAHSLTVRVYNDRVALAHCHQMLDKMEQFLNDGKIEKFMRWLGFIQGVLWRCHEFSLEELKSHNRPD